MYYHRLGNIPPKRHTQFRQPDGSLYKEELVSSEGFSGIYSNLYHIYPPTRIKEVKAPEKFRAKRIDDYALRQTHLNTSKVGETGEDYLTGRKTLLINNDCALSICSPKKRTMDYFYKNADADEVIFVHEGSGKLKTQYGELSFDYGDYLVVPRGSIYQIEFEKESRNFLKHGHDPNGCDLIVCWEHNWPECPVEVLALRDVILGQLAPGKQNLPLRHGDTEKSRK